MAARETIERLAKEFVEQFGMEVVRQFVGQFARLVPGWTIDGPNEQLVRRVAEHVGTQLADWCAAATGTHNRARCSECRTAIKGQPALIVHRPGRSMLHICGQQCRDAVLVREGLEGSACDA